MDVNNLSSENRVGFFGGCFVVVVVILFGWLFGGGLSLSLDYA